MPRRKPQIDDLTGADLARVERLLEYLDLAAGPEDLDVAGFRFHPVKGGRRGQWGIRVSDTCRITFRFKGSDVYDVDLVGYD